MSPTEAGREAQKREVFKRMVWEATSTQTCQDESESERDYTISNPSLSLKTKNIF